MNKYLIEYEGFIFGRVEQGSFYYASTKSESEIFDRVLNIIYNNSEFDNFDSNEIEIMIFKK